MWTRPIPALLVALALLAAPGIGACAGGTSTAPAPAAPASQPQAPVRVDVPTWMAVALSPGTVVIDVRTPEEFASGHVEGALNIPVEFADFAQRIAELDPAATYAVYCRSGNRSAVATAEMNTLGYPHVYDLDGGFTDLESAGMPSA